MNISMTTVPISAFHPFVSIRVSSHTLATSFSMAPKRKEIGDPTTPAAPTIKKQRNNATAARVTPATTPKPLVATKVPTMTPAALQPTTKNPSYSFGTPPTNETIVHALDYCLHPGVPLYSLVHPEAAKLFESVKTPDEFFIASHVFWATFFINQRGCPTRLIGKLLAQLISKNAVLVKAANEEGNNYEETFQRIHDSIESGFIATTDALSNEWISSPAGEVWLAELGKARKAKKPIGQVDETHMRGFKMDGQFYKGIELANIFRMWRYWGQVLYVTNIQKVTGQGIETFWPEDDLTRGTSRPDSLFLRLHRAMVGALVGVINVQAPNHGRARRILSDPDTTQNILHAAYTEGTIMSPTTEDERHRPEHIRMIQFRNLTEWSDHLPTGPGELDEDNDSKNPASSPLSRETTGTLAENPSSDWKDGIPQEAAEGAEADEKRAENVMLEVLKDAVAEHILSDIPFENIFSLADYPPRRIQPLPSMLATELTYFNWWGRTYLHKREGRERIQHLEGLMLAARMEINEIKKRETELEEEEKALKAAAQMYEDIQAELRTRQEDEQSLRRTVRDLKKHPVLDAGVRGFNATARTRAMSNPESPAKPANVLSLASMGITNNCAKTGGRFPDFDLDMESEDGYELKSSEDGMSNRGSDEDETSSQKILKEKSEEVVDKEYGKEMEEGNPLKGTEKNVSG